MEGVGGLGFMYAEGVLGGSKFGIDCFHASTNLESTAVSTGRSVENGQRHLIVAAEDRARRNFEACLNIFLDF